MPYTAVFPQPVPLTPRPPRSLDYLNEGANNILALVQEHDKGQADPTYGRLGIRTYQVGQIDALKLYPALEVTWEGVVPQPATWENGRVPSGTDWVLYTLTYYPKALEGKEREQELMRAAAFLSLLLRHYETLHGWCLNSEVVGAGPEDKLFRIEGADEQTPKVALKTCVVKVRANYDWKELSLEDGGQTPRRAVHPAGPEE